MESIKTSSRGLPCCLRKIYSNHSFMELTYSFIRWELCPFVKIESMLPKKGFILDVGCGYGLLSNFIALKSPERQIIGIDTSESRISAAQRTAHGRDNIKFINQDVNSFNIPPCDAIVMSDVLHHLPVPAKERLLGKIFQSLKTDGLLVIQDVDTIPRLKYFFTYLVDFLLNIRSKLFYQSAEVVEKMLREKGFIVNSVPAHEGYLVADVIFVCKKARQ